MFQTGRSHKGAGDAKLAGAPTAESASAQQPASSRGPTPPSSGPPQPTRPAAPGCGASARSSRPPVTVHTWAAATAALGGVRETAHG